jgi:DNA-binding MarR family transcriptional regulator
MTLQTKIQSISASATAGAALPDAYLEVLGQLERLHRLLLDLIKDEFERLRHHEINPVQALLLYNIGAHEVSVGELKSRGYYQGSNVSYNLKKLVELGYMHQQRSISDRRSIRVRLTEKGLRARCVVAELFDRQANDFATGDVDAGLRLEETGETLRGLERFWTQQIRYIY